MEESGSIPGRGKISILHKDQTVSGAKPISYKMGTGLFAQG
jgi:hypothetical protein